MGLPPKTAFIAGLVSGVLVICAVGFFILLGLMLQRGGLVSFNATGDKQMVATTTPTTTTNTPAAAATDPNAPVVPIDASTVKPVSSDDRIYGNANAKVTLIEYSDYECPFCKEFEPSMEQLMTDLKGQVRWVYRQYPLSFHQNAHKESEAALCVNEIGGNDKFWAFTQKIFQQTTSNGTGFALTALPGLAQSIGVDQKKFEDCYNAGKYASQVDQEEQTGVTAGVTGTPGTIVLDQSGHAELIRGAIDYTTLKSTVQSLL